MSSLTQLAPRVFVWQRLNQAVFLARNIALAWFFLPADQGLFATALNLAGYLTMFTTFEFRTAMLTARDSSRSLYHTQWTSEVGVALFNLILGLVAAPLLASSRGTGVAGALVGLLAANLLEAAGSSPTYELEKAMRFPYLSAARVFVNAASLMVCVGLGILGWGWKALVVDRIASAVFLSVLLWSRAGWLPRVRFAREDLRLLWSFAKILFFCGVLAKVVFSFDLYAVGRWLGKEPAGLFYQAMKWALIPMELGGGFLAVMALSFYSAKANSGLEAMSLSYRELTYHLARACVWVAAGLALFLPDLFRFYKPEWRQAPEIYRWLLVYALVRPLYQNASQALSGMQRLHPVFWVMLAQSALTIPAIWLGLRWGLPGVCLATGLSLLAGYVALEVILERTLKSRAAASLVVPIVMAGALAPVAMLVDGAGWRWPVDFAARVAIFALYTLLAWAEWRRGRPSLHSRA